MNEKNIKYEVNYASIGMSIQRVHRDESVFNMQNHGGLLFKVIPMLKEGFSRDEVLEELGLSEWVFDKFIRKTRNMLKSKGIPTPEFLLGITKRAKKKRAKPAKSLTPKDIERIKAFVPTWEVSITMLAKMYKLDLRQVNLIRNHSLSP